TASKKFQVQQHLKTSKHIRLEAVKSNSAQKEQQLLLACSSKSGPDRSQFNADLCKAFVLADIPLHKLNNRCLKSFLEQYTGKKVPDESTLRKNYVSQLFKDTMEIIRRKGFEKLKKSSLVARVLTEGIGEEEEEEDKQEGEEKMEKKSRNEHQGQKKSRNEHQGQKKSRNEHQGQKKSRNEHQGQKKSRNERQGQKKSRNEHQGQKKSRNEHQ
ncbi:hypothetical protein Hamer_G029594, partial [Homarus americanus]